MSLYTTALGQTTVTNHYELGRSAPLAAGPTGGSVDASGLVGTGARYSTSTALTLLLAKGTDPDGLATTGAQLLRATAALTSSGGTANGSCGSFGSYVLVTGGTDPVSPFSDSVGDQACYHYRYVVPDALGTSTTYTSPDIKVDSTAPAAPSLAFSGFANAFQSGSGAVYYRSSATSGGFTVTATATDGASGIASYAFPALGANWTATAGSLGVNTYSWSASPAAPGSVAVNATNNASGASANTTFTLTADDAGPSAGTITYDDTSTSSTSVSINFTTGTDAGSGVATRLLQRSTAPLTGTTCGTYDEFTTPSSGTNPTSPHADTAPGGFCYRYQYVVSDNVGNQHTATSASVVKVTANTNYFDAVSADASLNNYYRMSEALSSSPISDSEGTNHGTYFGGPTMGQTGAIGGNTAVQFDGVDDYGSIARQISQNFSIEFWFKSTQGLGTDPRWTQGAGLVDANVSGTSNDFGVSLRADGSVVAGVGGGTGDTSIVSSVGGYNDGQWHHVVFTRTKVSGTFTLYVDGVNRGSATNNTGNLTASATMAFGRVASGSNYYAGLLDEIAIYSSALTDATITAHYNAR